MTVVEPAPADAAVAVELAAAPQGQDGLGLSLLDGVNLALITLPVAVRTAVRHVLGLSAPSQYVDLRSEVVVAVIRSLIIPRQPPLSVPSFFTSAPPSKPSPAGAPSYARSISDSQRLLNRDPGIKGPIWISKYTAPGAGGASEDAALRDALVDVVKRLHDEEGDGLEGGAPLPPDIRWPDVVPVEAEWTGHRAGAGPDATLPPGTTEAERYAALMRDATAPQPTTVLYLHGGAMYLLDPATYRKATLALARRVHGRCYSVRYRLAPAAAFPAQVLDALVSYLTLLYPPPGAFHEAVSPGHVVFAGDSAGGNLCLALTRVLLDFQRRGTRVSWHGSRRPVPLPAGVAVNSPWIDVSSSFPSWQPPAESGRGDFDYLPAQAVPGADALGRPPCAAWPSSPPRRFLYAETCLVAHPLVTLLAGAADGWRGAPPVYLCVGWELLADEILFFAAARLHGRAAAVVLEQYEAMPHCFAVVLPRLVGARRCLDGWAAFVRRAVEEPATLRGPSASSFTHIEAKTLRETPLDPATLSPYSDEAARAGVRARLAGLEGAAKL